MQTLNSWVTDEITSRVQIMSPNSEWEDYVFVCFINEVLFLTCMLFIYCFLNTYLRLSVFNLKRRRYKFS